MLDLTSVFCFQDLFSHHRHECCVSNVFQIDFLDGTVSPKSCTLLGTDQVFCIFSFFFSLDPIYHITRIGENSEAEFHSSSSCVAESTEISLLVLGESIIV